MKQLLEIMNQHMKTVENSYVYLEFFQIAVDLLDNIGISKNSSKLDCKKWISSFGSLSFTARVNGMKNQCVL